MAFFKTCKKTRPRANSHFPVTQEAGTILPIFRRRSPHKNIRRNTIPEIPPTTYPAFCMIKRRRGATAEKIGTKNGLAPCALLLTFGRTVGLSLSIRSIPPVRQEMNPSAGMIVVFSLFPPRGACVAGPILRTGKMRVLVIIFANLGLPESLIKFLRFYNIC